MPAPCFRKKCIHVMKGVSDVHRTRTFEGKPPIELPNSKSLFGVEEFCLLCWNSLPEKEKFDSEVVETKINPNNYKYLNAGANKWTGPGI